RMSGGGAGAGSGQFGGGGVAWRRLAPENPAHRRRPTGPGATFGKAPRMTARIIDGKAIAAALRQTIASRAATLPYRPGLRVVRVGEDPASRVYVRNKDKAAREAGFDSATIALPATATEAELLAVVARLNADDAVDGILVQLPLPPQIRADRVIAAVAPE